ncbi:isoprenylcysteine carboxyl methyltransferase [Rhypophila decipiens]|uniref:Protein-S-isoprenylcysteine O-methyltransferase n=1 Tax=Rhypophila decipiens TaxID=261697 RepID=A0AAN6Y007_9PEZI|nr:isoprenylcysteine carboxyl methyltransferase [Rhypophila decipiens]
MGYSSDLSSDSEPDLGPVVGSHEVRFDDKLHLPHQPKSLEGIAMRAFGLGAALATSLVALVLVRLWYPASPHWRHAFYGATLSTFHFLEFWTTARYSTSDASAKSFFPTENLPVYLMAHMLAFLECLGWGFFKFGPGFDLKVLGPTPRIIPIILGLVLVGGGQLVRILAIVHAGSALGRNKKKHRERRGAEPVLVTSGIYGIMRHPAYFGFFWWAVGAQLVLGNIFSLLAAVVVLWSIFAGQVQREEACLRLSLGRPYLRYEERVGTLMPFIG